MSHKLSSKLERIRRTADEIRALSDTPNAHITELKSAVEAKMQEQANIIAEKEAEIAELSAERSVYRVSSEEGRIALSTAKENDLCTVINAKGTYPINGVTSQTFIFKRVVDFGMTVRELMNKLTEEYGIDVSSGSTYYSVIFRPATGDNTEQVTIQLRPMSSRLQIYLRYQDKENGRQHYLSGYTSSLTATTLTLTGYYYDEEGVQQTITTPTHTITTRQPLTLSANTFPADADGNVPFPYDLVDTLTELSVVDYKGNYVYHESGWEKVREGFDLDPENVLKGQTYLSDAGVQTGTLGEDIYTNLEKLREFSKVFGAPSDGTWRLNAGTSDASNAALLKSLYNTETNTLSPAVEMLQLTSSSLYGLFSSSYLGAYTGSIDFSKMRKDILGKPTSLRGMYSGTKLSYVNLGDLDVSRVTTLENMYNGAVPYDTIKDELVKERYYPNVTNYAYCLWTTFTGLKDNSVVEIKNKRFAHAPGTENYFIPITTAGGPHLNILLENIVFEETLTGIDTITSACSDRPYSICIRNCTLPFKSYSSLTDKTNHYQYAFGYNYDSYMEENGCGSLYAHNKLKYLIFDIDYVLNIPAYFNVTDSWGRVADTCLRLCPLYTAGGAIYVRDEMVSAYKNSSNWSYFSSYIKPISEMCDEMKQLYGYGEVANNE